MSTDNNGQSDPYVFPATAGNIKKKLKTIVFLHSWYKCTMYKTGLISKAVKTYFDQKAVKTRLKPVKTGLNRSKRGQNLKLRNMCQGLWKNSVR